MNKNQQMVINLAKNNYKFNDILEESAFSKSELLLIMYKLIHSKECLPWDIELNLRSEYLNNFSFITLTDSRVIFISDTHLGSIDENVTYLEQVHDFIRHEKIEILFHGGDIGDGMIKPHPNYNSYSSQINHILDCYADSDDVYQYILAGNHDARYKNQKMDILNELVALKSSIVSLGYYQAYFKVFDKIISFEHNSHMNIKNKLVKSDFTIAGHSHIGLLGDNKVRLSTLSDSMPHRNSKDNLPGFMTLTTSKDKNKVKLYFRHYNVSKRGIQKVKTKEYILK